MGSDTFQSGIKPVAEKVMGGALRLFTEYVFEGSFYSDPGKTTLYVHGQMPEGCTIEQLNEAVRKMEQYISQFSEIEQFETRITGYKNSSITIQFTKEAEKSSFPYLLKSQLYLLFLLHRKRTRQINYLRITSFHCSFETKQFAAAR